MVHSPKDHFSQNPCNSGSCIQFHSHDASEEVDTACVVQSSCKPLFSVQQVAVAHNVKHLPVYSLCEKNCKSKALPLPLDLDLDDGRLRASAFS